MALIPGYDRASAEYLKAIEDELSQKRVSQLALEDELDHLKSDHATGTTKDVKDPTLMATLKTITDRLAKLETGTTSPPPPLPPPPVPPVTLATTAAATTAATTSTASTATTTAASTSPVLAGSGLPISSSSSTLHGHSISMTPAQALGVPLTATLQRIGSTELQLGREYDPYSYVLATKNATDAKIFDRTKMDLNDLFYGWMKVATMVLNTAGDIRSYLSHLSFSSEMYHSRKFSVKGLIDYDAYIVQSVVNGTMPCFKPDPIGASLHFSPNVIQDISPSFPFRSGRGRRGGRRMRQNYQEEKLEIPSDFPPEICYLYNYRSCQGNCGRNHVCRVCKGKHDARSCTVKKA